MRHLVDAFGSCQETMEKDLSHLTTFGSDQYYTYFASAAVYHIPR